MGHAALPRARKLTEMLDLLRLKPHSSRELATHFKWAFVPSSGTWKSSRKMERPVGKRIVIVDSSW